MCVVIVVPIPSRLSQDAKSLGESDGFCLSHGRRCHVPSLRDVDFFVGGFVCKSNSQMTLGQQFLPQTVQCYSFVCSVPLQQRNSKRFGRDPLSEKAESLTTFDMMLSVLRRHQPRHVLLENVKGAQPRA